jgi:MerR family transcriptional regulator, light-induced transcriptional regulator
MESHTRRLMARSFKLQEAADLLGVHYMTAYRYVRLGQLAAVKDNGIWHVSHEDLEAFQNNRRVVAPVLGDDDGEAVGVRRRVRWDTRLESCLVAGDAAGAWSVVESALSSGMTPAQIYVDVLGPAMVSIGHRWEIGELGIGVEHRASGIATRITGRLGPRFARRGRRRGLVVVGSPVGEHHALAGAMLADLLRGGGYEVADIGVDVPATPFVESCVPEAIAACVSITNPAVFAAGVSVVAAIRLAYPKLLIVLGGQATRAHPAAAAALGADAVVASADELLDMLDALPAGAAHGEAGHGEAAHGQ